MVNRRVMLTFPQELLKEPIIYNLDQQFNVVINIYSADIAEDRDRGWLIVELMGDEKQIEDGLTWVMSRGVRVDTMAES